MTSYVLCSPKENTTISKLARLFERTPEQSLVLAVHEDSSCQHWIPLGKVVLRPGLADPVDEELDPFETAVRFGAFEWAYPDHDEVMEAARSATERPVADGKQGSPSKGEKRGGDDPLRRFLEHIPFVAARVGLLSPHIDAGMASALPFRRPVTIVMDTSAILQGGLDFAVRFLSPAARIRVPAVVHMEFLSQTDNYLKIRRGDRGGSPGRAMLERANGVGGQRTLIRVERSNDVEIERATVGADPLRGIVRLVEEDKNLFVEHVQRSFADRLIFETAREHQSRCAPGHRVLLMTSDEGLSRMTLAEGMASFLVRAPKPEDISNTVLTGTCFHPFKGDVYAVPLASLLWELAATFGAARLASGSEAFEVRAIGKELPWSPYHTLEDLLWMRLAPVGVEQATTPAGAGGGDAPAPKTKPPATATGAKQSAQADKPPVPTGRRAGTTVPQPHAGKELDITEPAIVRERSGAYKFSLKRMLPLVNALAEKRTLSLAAALAALEVDKERVLTDYKNFLAAGGFIETTGDGIKATALLLELWEALGEADSATTERLFCLVPSVRAFFEHLKARRNLGEQDDLPVPARAFSTYAILAEVSAAGLSIPDEGLYATDARPSVPEFSAAAWKAYSSLARGEEYVSTGEWLEKLAREHAIHPVRAGSLLESAWKEGLLDRFFEGSTPDTRYENHSFWALTGRKGAPDVHQVKLYHGDFLMPGRASVSLCLVKKGMS